MARDDGGERVVPAAHGISTTEAIVNELTTQILDGTLEPGVHLPEVELAERLSVSRPSLRVALAELVHLGLVNRERHRGVRVRSLTRRDVRDLYFLREVIESAAIRRLATAPMTATPGPIEQMVQVLEGLPENARWGDVVEADVAIHRAIVDAVGSPRMSRAWALLGTEIRLTVAPRRKYIARGALAAAHRELIEAIRSGDAEAAVRRFVWHLDLGSDDLLALLPEDGEPLTRS
jgi:DNA-binding GntR family transcriptional regulator